MNSNPCWPYSAIVLSRQVTSPRVWRNGRSAGPLTLAVIRPGGQPWFPGRNTSRKQCSHQGQAFEMYHRNLSRFGLAAQFCQISFRTKGTRVVGTERTEEHVRVRRKGAMTPCILQGRILKVWADEAFSFTRLSHRRTQGCLEKEGDRRVRPGETQGGYETMRPPRTGV